MSLKVYLIFEFDTGNLFSHPSAEEKVQILRNKDTMHYF